MWSVDTTFVDDWLDTLDDDSADQVLAALTILRDMGPALGRPLVDTVTGSRHKNMKELRPGSRGRSELRVLFAFDPVRRAVLLVAGDKAGNWKKWYRVNIPVADDRFDQHNQSLRNEEGGPMMAKTLDERIADLSPERRAKVEAHRQQMLGEVRAYRLRELREQRLLSQAQVADRIHVSQRRVSGIESGDIEKTQVDTLRKYVDAVGGTLRIEVEIDGDRYQIA